MSVEITGWVSTRNMIYIQYSAIMHVYYKQNLVLRWLNHCLRHCQRLSIQIEGKIEKVPMVISVEKSEKSRKTGFNNWNIRKSQKGTKSDVQKVK